MTTDILLDKFETIGVVSYNDRRNQAHIVKKYRMCFNISLSLIPCLTLSLTLMLTCEKVIALNERSPKVSQAQV